MENGRFIEKDQVEITNSSYVTISHNSRYLYSITDFGVEAYKIEEDGSLTVINQGSINGMRGCYLSTDYEDKFLFVAGYHDGKITVLRLLEDGQIGDIVTIKQTENVGYFHFAHSYVRGNWRDEFTSTPSIMAKCCHDIDLIAWFMDSSCLSVSSVGSLNHFRKENAPEGATPTCMGGCKAKKNCPYDAEALYITDPFYKAKFIKYMGRTLTGKVKNSKQDIRNAIKNGDYGRCVYMCDNNVCDNQLVTMTFENGASAVLNMNGLSNKMFRECHIVGTKGELVGSGTKLKMHIFGGKTTTVNTGSLNVSGHVEGDIRLVSGFVKLLCGETKDLTNITTIDATVISHNIALAAEESRKNGGEVVLLKD